MATNGNKARIKINSKLINQPTSEDFSSKTAAIDITSKTSAGDKEVIMGLAERSLNFEMVFDKKPSGSPTDLYFTDIVTLKEARTLTTWEYAMSDVSGDVKFTGNCYVADYAVKAASDDKVTVAVSIMPTGAVTVGTV